jgi:hypothetical protein
MSDSSGMVLTVASDAVSVWVVGMTSCCLVRMVPGFPWRPSTPRAHLILCGQQTTRLRGGGRGCGGVPDARKRWPIGDGHRARRRPQGPGRAPAGGVRPSGQSRRTRRRGGRRLRWVEVHDPGCVPSANTRQPLSRSVPLSSSTSHDWLLQRCRVRSGCVALEQP